MMHLITPETLMIAGMLSATVIILINIEKVMIFLAQMIFGFTVIVAIAAILTYLLDSTRAAMAVGAVAGALVAITLAALTPNMIRKGK